MRAYTSMYLAVSCVFGQACTGMDLGPYVEPYRNAPTLPEERTDCDLQGTWDVTLSDSELCAPQGRATAVSLTVDEDDAGSDDFALSDALPSSPCGAYNREAHVAADGCTISASSLATWCDSGEPQCSDYELKLHVRDGTAEVEGTFRTCWCGSPSAFGTKVDVVGHAVRR